MDEEKDGSRRPFFLPRIPYAASYEQEPAEMIIFRSGFLRPLQIFPLP